jgi:hypothetical protein
MSDYLGITESSATITIETDDWKIVFDEGKGGVIDEFYTTESGATNIIDNTYAMFFYFFYTPSSSQQYATNAVMVLIEYGPLYVHIHVDGELSDNEGWTFAVDYYVYESGKIFADYYFKNDTGDDQTIGFQGLALKFNVNHDAAVGDNSNDTSPTYNSEFWNGHYDTSLGAYVNAYILECDNSKFYQGDWFTNDQVIWYRHGTTETFTDGEEARIRYCIDFGGTETTEANIEARGVFLVPAHRTDATINTGSAEADWNIPANLDDDGLASDGALHVLASSNEVAIEFNQDEKGTAVALAGFDIQTGDPASPDTYLSMHLKLDQAYETTKVREEVSDSNIGTLTGSPSFAPCAQGNGIVGETSSGGYLKLSSAEIDSLVGQYKKGTIIFNFTPNTTSFDAASSEYLFSFGHTSVSYALFQYGYSDFRFNWVQNYTTYIDVKWDKPFDMELGRPVTVHLAFDIESSYPIAMLAINGEVLSPQITDLTQNSGTDIDTFTGFFINALIYAATQGGDQTIDNFKWYESVILPYGAYFTGNGEVDAAVSHKSILFYADFEGATENDRLTDKIAGVTGTLGSSNGAITVGSALNGSYGFDTEADDSDNTGISWDVTSWDIVKEGGGTLNAKIKFNSVGNFDYVLGLYANSSNFLSFNLNSTGDIRLQMYEQGSSRTITTAAGLVTTGIWYDFTLSWDDLSKAGIHHLYVDGVLVASVTAVFGMNADIVQLTLGSRANPSGGAYSCDAYFDEVYITDNPDPKVGRIWTVDGLPINLPMREAA